MFIMIFSILLKCNGNINLVFISFYNEKKNIQFLLLKVIAVYSNNSNFTHFIFPMRTYNDFTKLKEISKYRL